MQFLKGLFWCLLAFVAAVFTLGNWRSVPIQLWGGLIAETNLPLLLLCAFLLGLLPTLAFQHVVRWRLRGRLAAAERLVEELRALPVPEHGAVVTPTYPAPAPEPVAPSAGPAPGALP